MQHDYGRPSYRPQGQDRGGYNRGERPQRRSTPLSDLDPELTGISHKVIGLATEVHMAIGSGFPEEVYSNAMQRELTAAGIAFKAGHRLDVKHKGETVGSVTADLFIADQFIVEVMAAPVEIGSYERTMLRAQLRAADVVLGLIINFAGRRLKDGLVRVINPDKLTPEQRGETEGGEEGDEGDED